MPSLRLCARLAVGLFVLVAPAAAVAQSPAALPMGNTAAGSLGANGEAVRYRFNARAPGVLTVVAHGTADLVLAAMDSDGQPLQDGTADRDLGGSFGSEVLSVVIGEPGDYLVEVRSNGSPEGRAFTVGGTWIAMPAFARPGDPDRRPSQARQLAPGASHEDQLHPDEGDMWDWYTFRATEAMSLVAVTSMDESVDGDLAIDVHLNGDFANPVTTSDQDLQGNLGSESATVTVKAGDTVHVKVRSVSSRGGAAPYRVSLMRVP